MQATELKFVVNNIASSDFKFLKYQKNLANTEYVLLNTFRFY